MTNAYATQSAQKPMFGKKPNELSGALETQRVRRVLDRRIEEKIQNYDRVAMRLELRGETDAAAVLSRAAQQLREIVIAS